MRRKSRAWTYATIREVPKLVTGGMPARAQVNEAGYIRVITPGGMHSLHVIRESTPLSVHIILKYPSGKMKDDILAEEKPVGMTNGRARVHTRVARWVALMMTATERNEFIEKSHGLYVPDKVFESRPDLAIRSILVHYGVHRFSFFRGIRENDISPDKHRYDILAKCSPVKIASGGALVFDPNDPKLHDTARAWAKRYAELVPRVADVEQIKKKAAKKRQEEKPTHRKRKNPKDRRQKELNL